MDLMQWLTGTQAGEFLLTLQTNENPAVTAITRGLDGKLHGNFHEQYFNSTQIGRA